MADKKNTEQALSKEELENELYNALRDKCEIFVDCKWSEMPEYLRVAFVFSLVDICNAYTNYIRRKL